MAKLVYGLNVSLDGYVNHDGFAPDPVLFAHFTELTRHQTGSVYGRVMYEVMRYWDQDDPNWGDAERAYAKAWRNKPIWVASRTLKSVGANATLIDGDVEAAVRALKAEQSGEIEVIGPALAHSLAGLIDEYHLYLHPVVLGAGKPFFAGPLPRLRLTASDHIGPEAIKLIYVPA